MRLLKMVFVTSVLALLLGVRAIYGDVYIDNQSTSVPQAALVKTVKAIQLQLDNELYPAWGVTQKLRLGQAPEGAWRVTITDQSPYWGVLGYHDIADVPVAYVYGQTSLEFGFNWQVTLGHEILEMVVDPWADRLVKSSHLYIVEVADPVEQPSYGKWVISDGLPVLLSDFVTPAWYYGGGGSYDAYGHVQQSEQILPGGFAYYWQGGWVPTYPKGNHATHRKRHFGWKPG